MKIAIDVSTFRGRQGTEVYAESMIRALLAEHPDVSFVIYKPTSFLSELNDMADSGRRVTAVNFAESRSSMLAVIRQQAWVPLRVLWDRPSVLLSFSPFFSFLAPVRKVVTIHDCAYAQYAEYRNVFSRWYINAALFLAKFLRIPVVTSSQFSKQELQRVYGITNVWVVSGAAPAVPSELPRLDGSFFTERGVKKPFFVYVGITSARKNLARLLDAFAIFVKKHPGVQLVLGGKIDTTFLDIHARAVELGIESQVVQLGFVSEAEKLALLQEAVALVYPSLLEGFGIPVLEAQVLQLPVITAQSSSLPEVAGDGAAYVDPLDVDDIARQMTRVFEDEKLRGNLIQAGIENVRLFSWSRSARELLNHIRKIS